ncbi:MAG: hypothetical protein WC364_05780 [Eubacteriales bacterium]|jgi:hypothetical protein
MNDLINQLSQLTKISEEVQKIMADFNSKHAPTQAAIHHREHQREYYHRHKYDMPTMLRHIQNKQTRHDITTQKGEFIYSPNVPEYMRQSNFAIGKFGIFRVKEYLTSFGCVVTDVENESPFNLLVTMDGISYILDVKVQTGTVYFYISNDTLFQYKQYITSAIKNVVFIRNNKFYPIELNTFLQLGVVLPDTNDLYINARNIDGYIINTT